LWTDFLSKNIPEFTLIQSTLQTKGAQRNTEKEWIVNVIQYNTPKSRYKPHQPAGLRWLLYRFSKPATTGFL